MDKYSWLFDVLDLDIIGEVGARKTVDLGLDAIKNRFEDENKKNLLKCALCPNMCEFACPVLTAEGRETVSPSRKSKLGYFYSSENMEADEIGNNIYYCLSCDACKENCPLELSVCDLLVPVREKLYEEGITFEGIEKVNQNLKSTGTIYEEIEEREQDKTETGSGKALYFRSCVARENGPEIIDATKDILSSLQEEIQILDEEICCGGPAKNLGLTDTFSEIAERNVELLNESGAEKIVCGCPTCTYVLREVYPDEGYDIDAEVYHITEYLADLLPEKNVNLKLDEPKSITYHDPCTLARKLETTEKPREILYRIQNLNLEEPYFNKGNTRCCGRGGALKFVDEELEQKIADDRIQHLSDYGETVVTSCPSCRYRLGESSEDVEVVSLVEIIAEALG